MIIYECDDDFIIEISNDDDFETFLTAFTANDDIKYHNYEEDD